MKDPFLSSFIAGFIFFLCLCSLASHFDYLNIGIAFVCMIVGFSFACMWFIIEKFCLKLQIKEAPLYHSQKNFLIFLLQDDLIATYFQEHNKIFKATFLIKNNILQPTQLFSFDPFSSEWNPNHNDEKFSISPLILTQSIYAYYSQKTLTTPFLLNIQRPSLSPLYPHIQNDLTFLQENQLHTLIDFQNEIQAKEIRQIQKITLKCYVIGGLFFATPLSIIISCVPMWLIMCLSSFF